MKMNETNLTESQLNSWQPRHPSAALKRRLFPTAQEISVTPRWLWGALTPTMACLMMTMIVLNSSNTVIHPKPSMAMIMSNVDGLFCAWEGDQ